MTAAMDESNFSVISSLAADYASYLLEAELIEEAAARAGAWGEDYDGDVDNISASQDQIAKRRASMSRSLLSEASSSLLVGRDDEVRLLQGAYKRMRERAQRLEDEKECTTEVIFLHGISGSGKTALARHALRDHVLMQETEHGQTKNGAGGYFVEGKWDQVLNNAPFTAIVAALSDLMDLVEQSDDFGSKQQCRIREQLLREAAEDGDDCKLLLLKKFFPRLDAFLDLDKNAEERKEPDVNVGYSSSLCKAPPNTDREVRGAFQSLVRGLSSSPEHPIVFFLDDIQWANQGSIDLLRSLLTDPESSHNVLWILAARDVQVDNCSAKDAAFELLSSISQESVTTTTVTEIGLKNLTLDNVHEIVCHHLGIDSTGGYCTTSSEKNSSSSSPWELAKVVMSKTGANPLQVDQYLLSLREKGYLPDDPMTDALVGRTLAMGVSFDVHQIANETNISQCDADQIKLRINSLDTRHKNILVVAAFVGHKFCKQDLDHVVRRLALDDEWERGGNQQAQQHQTDCPGNASLLEESLIVACNERLLERLSGRDDWYKFTHDSIQQRLYECVMIGAEQSRLHSEIGRHLMEKQSSAASGDSNHFDQDISSALVFQIADHMNRGKNTLSGVRELQQLAHLNCSAARSALSHSDFFGASHFSTKGLNCLDWSDSWNTDHDNHDLCLELHDIAAQTAFLLGNFDDCHAIATELVANTTTLASKKKAYLAKLMTLRAQNKSKDTMTLGLQILRDSGEDVPASPSIIRVFRKLRKARRLLRGLSEEDVVALPERPGCEDASFNSKVLCLLCNLALTEGDKLFALHGFLHMVQMTVRQKAFFPDTTPIAFTLYGYVERACGNIAVAHKYGLLVLELLKRRGTEDSKSRGLTGTAVYLLHAKTPLEQAVVPCMKGFQAALSGGEIVFAPFPLSSHFFFRFCCEKNLIDLERSMRRYSLRLKHDYKQETLSAGLLVLWQFVLCFIGFTDDPTLLNGEATEEQTLIEVVEQSNNKMLLAWYRLFKLELAFTFESSVAAREAFATAYWKAAKATEKMHFYTQYGRFFFALTSIDLYKETKKRKHLRAFNRRLRDFKKLKALGFVNETPLCLFLEAEKVALLSKSTQRKQKMVEAKYEEALVSTKTASFRRLEALVHERVGGYLIRNGSISLGNSRLRTAKQLYVQLGSSAKVEHMMRDGARVGETTETQSWIPSNVVIS